MSVVKRDALEKMPRHGKKRYKNRQMMEAQGQMNVSVAKDVRMMEAQGQMNVSVATDKQMLECFYFFFFPPSGVLSSFSVSDCLPVKSFYSFYPFY